MLFAPRRRTITSEFLKSNSGKLGVVLLLIILGASAYVLAAYPPDFGLKSWSNPAVWADNPRNAPPVWSNLFTTHKAVPQQVIQESQPTQAFSTAGSRTGVYDFRTNLEADEPPTLLSLSVSDVTFSGRPPLLTVEFLRPDNMNLPLYSFVVPGAGPGESPPVTRYHSAPFRVELTGDPSVAATTADLARNLGVDLNSLQLASLGTPRILFGTPVNGSFITLKGIYDIRVSVQLYDIADSVGTVGLTVGGTSFGLMGTDSLGRDLAVGLLFGFPVALFIGGVTAFLTTIIGTFAGIVSGYAGGRTDTFIQRIADVLNNIPLLPILIFFAFIYGQKLWLVVLVLSVFGWPGVAVLMRSMALQIRSEQFVEAAEVIGSSRFNVIARHIFPQTAPFALAQMVFTVPAAILAEAALSFLGLGDPSIPTWGQILESGFRSGGVYVGYWWWVLPPGFLIVFTAMAFVLISLGLEPAVNPKLRRLR